jgi:hypothetical protein
LELGMNMKRKAVFVNKESEMKIKMMMKMMKMKMMKMKKRRKKMMKIVSIKNIKVATISN